MSIISNLGLGTGLIYATELDGIQFVISGIANDRNGSDNITRDALNRGGLAYDVSATGSTTITTIGANDTIDSLTINGIEQFNTGSPIAVSIGAESDAATALANAVNNFRPSSGPNYRAFVIGGKTIFQAPSSSGSTPNGDVVNLTFGLPGSQTWTEQDVSGGSFGGELLSQVHGLRYWLNPTTSALPGDLTGATEITDFIVFRGNQGGNFEQSQTIASASVNPQRKDRFSVLKLGAGANVELDVISGDFAKNDIMILMNDSAFTIKVNDLSINSGNIMLDPVGFSMLNDDYILTLIYTVDDVNGLVWKELWRTPQTVAVDSITNIEIAPTAVSTTELKDNAVTNIKMADNSVDTLEIVNDAVTTDKILDANVTTAKIADLNVTTDKMALVSVDSTILADNAVTTDKIVDDAVTVDKLGGTLTRGFFTFSVSWESATELGQVKAAIPFDMTVVEVVVSVANTIEATDTATLILKDQSLASMGQFDISGGVTIGNDFTLIPAVNNTFVAGEAMTFETLKTTVGGRAEVTVIYDLV